MSANRPTTMLTETVRRLVHHGAVPNVVKICQKTRPEDVAALFRSLTPAESRRLFDILFQHDRELSAEVLEEMAPQDVDELFEVLGDEKVCKVLQELPQEEATRLLELLPIERAERVLEMMRDETSEGVRFHLKYPEETAGRIMSTDFLALDEGLTVEEAIRQIQSTTERQMAFYLYVVDEREHLLGVISLRRLLMVRPETRLGQMIGEDVISARTWDDQEQVARIVAKYNLLAVPVVDRYNRLVGIVPVDDVVDILREEATEDMFRLAGTDEEEITARSTWTSVRLRLPWLLASLVGGFCAVLIASHYEATLAGIVAIAFFIPPVLGMGGNVGTQSSTIVVRGLATGNIAPSEFLRVVFKEVRIALLLGLLYGLLLGVAAWAMTRDLLLAGVVSSGLLVSMLLAALIGSALPILFQKLGVDPAVATGPFVTTATDTLGILAYLGLASLLLL
jgi:magnesium transporter